MLYEIFWLYIRKKKAEQVSCIYAKVLSKCAKLVAIVRHYALPQERSWQIALSSGHLQQPLLYVLAGVQIPAQWGKQQHKASAPKAALLGEVLICVWRSWCMLLQQTPVDHACPTAEWQISEFERQSETGSCILPLLINQHCREQVLLDIATGAVEMSS